MLKLFLIFQNLSLMTLIKRICIKKMRVDNINRKSTCDMCDFSSNWANGLAINVATIHEWKKLTLMRRVRWQRKLNLRSFGLRCNLPNYSLIDFPLEFISMYLTLPKPTFMVVFEI